MENIKKSPVPSKTPTCKSHNKENDMLIEELQYLVGQKTYIKKAVSAS